MLNKEINEKSLKCYFKKSRERWEIPPPKPYKFNQSIKNIKFVPRNSMENSIYMIIAKERS